MIRVNSQVAASGWLGLELRARARVAGLHLLLSGLVVASVIGPLIAILFPAEQFHLAGAAGLVGLIIAVDLVMGPGLTFCVAARHKDRAVLRRDVALIVALQLAALGFGVYSTVLSRPVFLTFVIDRFELVVAAEVDKRELERAAPAFRRLSWSGPVVLGAKRPDDASQREQLLLLASTVGVDLRHLISRYVPYEQLQHEALARAKPLSELMRTNSTAEFARALGADAAGASERLRWLPVQGKGEDQVALIDARSGELVRLVRLLPW